MIRETDIVHQTGDFWVYRGRSSYIVFRNGITAATSDSVYVRDPDGLSIAIARCDYLASCFPRAVK